MIDQSNRAGKSNTNIGEDHGGQKFLNTISTEHPRSNGSARHNQTRQTRGMNQNRKKLHRRSRPNENSNGVSIISPQLPFSYMSQGKIDDRLFIRFLIIDSYLMLSSSFI